MGKGRPLLKVMVAGFVAILVSGVFYFTVGIPLRKYIGFKLLSKTKIMTEAENYKEERFGKDVQACLYVVNCEQDKATLTLVNSGDMWDLTDTKTAIWQRKTTETCTGRTTNIGIQVISDGGELTISSSYVLALWSFETNDFYPQNSRFSGGAFTDMPWEKCTLENAIIK